MPAFSQPALRQVWPSVHDARVPPASFHASEGDGRGWHARLDLGFAPLAGATRLTRRRHRGPLLVQRPFHPEGPRVAHVYILHPPAGVVGGDVLEIDVGVEAGAHALLTTPAATKIYRSVSSRAVCRQRLRVADGAALEWLPQETIVFDGARADIRTDVELDGKASFLGQELYCLGRPAAGEAFEQGSVDLRFTVVRDGEPALLDRVTLHGGDPAMNAAACLRGFRVLATMIAAPGTDAMAECARSALDGQAGLHGVTCIDDVLVCRILSPDAALARRMLGAVWAAIRPAVMGRDACIPRIWRT